MTFGQAYRPLTFRYYCPRDGKTRNGWAFSWHVRRCPCTKKEAT